MPKRITLHVVLWREGWVVRKEDSFRAISTHNTQREAIDAARELARSKQGVLIIHRRSGRVLSRHRYNSDPLPPKLPPDPLFPDSVSDKARRAILETVRRIVQKSKDRASRTRKVSVNKPTSQLAKR